MISKKDKKYQIAFPDEYADISSEEMTYLDGGIYISNTDVAIITGAILSSGTLTVASFESAIRNQANVFAASLSRWMPGGIFIGGMLTAVVTAKALDFANAFVTALVQNKGVEITLGQQWGFIPDIKVNPK